MSTKRKSEDCETTTKSTPKRKKVPESYINHITVILACGELEHKIFVIPKDKLSDEFYGYLKLANGKHFGEDACGYFDKYENMVSLTDKSEDELEKLLKKMNESPSDGLEELIESERKQLKLNIAKKRKYFKKLVALTYVSIATGQTTTDCINGKLAKKKDIFRSALPAVIPLWWRDIGEVYEDCETPVVLPLSKLFLLYDQSV